MDTFAEKHNLNVMAGFTAERFAWYNTQARRDNVPNNLDQMQEVNAGQQGTDEANAETTYNTLVSFLLLRIGMQCLRVTVVGKQADVEGTTCLLYTSRCV